MTAPGNKVLIFARTLGTGYDVCEVAQATIKKTTLLILISEGYPRTLAQTVGM